VSFPIDIQTTGTYTVWVRARAADGGGDSLHVGLDGQAVETADNLTGFVPDEWSWSRLTLDSSNAILDLDSSGAYTLGLFMREDGIRVDKLLLITDTNYIPTGLGPEESQQQTVTATTPLTVVQVVLMAYDPLYRLSEADYSGAYTATYGYAYDAVGNRTAYTTTITSTTVITYQYDAANRLVESVEVGGDTTTYEWDAARRLITTTIGVNVSRVYTYSQDGDMLAALVNGLLTTFDYDGDGHRLRMSVAGEVTTYTLDYAGGFRVLLEEGGAFSDTKHYLYGLECIAELVDADEPESEWRFYQRDGNSLVRQTTNMQATVTLAWTYSPEGAVLLGEEGPVTNLDCSGNTIYDFSTGLIFKNGSYFDPNTGIWLTMSGVVVYQGGWLPYGRRCRWGKDRKRLILLSFLLLLALLLGGCVDGDPTPVIDSAQTPAPTPCPTPTSLPLATGIPTSIDTPTSTLLW
jgi:YD repeat-containing protein